MKEKSVSQFVTEKIQALQGFKEFWQERTDAKLLMFEEQWWDEFISWLES